MTRFALVCPPFPSHIRAFEAIAERLVARGHQATFLLPGDAASLVRARGVSVARLPAEMSSLDDRLRRAARPTGPFGILRTVSDAARATEALCARGPQMLRDMGAQAILGDEMEPAAGLIARHLNLPQISVASALPIESDRAIPPPFVDWPFDPSPKGLRRNRGAVRVTHLFLRRQRRAIEEWALRFGLAGLSSLEDCLSPVATISQTIPGLDFPRRSQTRIHHVGPLRTAHGAPEGLPFDTDPQRPLVYASFGTLQGHRVSMFQAIARASNALGAQLVVAHCGGLSSQEARSLHAHYVAADLPEGAVLARAAVCVTHGGLNTVLDALTAGVPLLAIPIAFDQPGVAARIERAGAGLKLPRFLLSERSVRAALERLLANAHFRMRAQALSAEIAGLGGAERAADIAEEVVATFVPPHLAFAEAAE